MSAAHTAVVKHQTCSADDIRMRLVHAKPCSRQQWSCTNLSTADMLLKGNRPRRFFAVKRRDMTAPAQPLRIDTFSSLACSVRPWKENR